MASNSAEICAVDERESALFTPLTLAGIQIRNRIAISPMCQYSAAADGTVEDWHLAHYGRFAMGGAGLVILEATAIAPEGRLSYGDVGLWDDAHIPGLKRIAAFLEAEGATPAVQLAHSGRKASTQRPWHGNGPLTAEDEALRGERLWATVSVTEEPHGPGFQRPSELSFADISHIRCLWRDAAARSLVAGFKAIEIHGAHGYLVHSFLSPLSNTRTDAYGSDLAGRMRFALETAESIRQVWPVHLPLMFRISSIDAAKNAWSIEDSVVLAKALKTKGVDLIDCSSGGIGADYSVVPRGPGFQVSFSETIKQKAGIATAAVGLITEPEQAETIVKEGRADIVAIGRQALFEPNWPHHARRVLMPHRRFDDWPEPSGWWLNRRRI